MRLTRCVFQVFHVYNIVIAVSVHESDKGKNVPLIQRLQALEFDWLKQLESQPPEAIDFRFFDETCVFCFCFFMNTLDENSKVID